MSPSARPPRRRSQVGQITAMLVILSICVLLAVVAVTDLSAAYLRRQAMASLADGAALAATEAAGASSVYADADAEFVAIDQVAAADAVDRYLRDTHAYADYPGLRADVVVAGHTVRVALAAPYTLPVTVPGVAGSTWVHGSSGAELPIY